MKTRKPSSHSLPSMLVSAQAYYYPYFAFRLTSDSFSCLAFPPSLASFLVTTFSNQCNCCRSCCCFSCCTEPFEIGALLPSEPHTSYVLGSDGQLRKEGTDGGLEEEMESMVNDAEEVNVVLVEDVEAVERDTSKDLS